MEFRIKALDTSASVISCVVDAVDEAETGLKSALAVKIFGPDLNLLAEKAAQVKDILAKTPGITEITEA